jgi:hypothetical protein
VFLTALILVLLGVAVTVAGARLTFAVLRLDPRETLLWLGLAETPAPAVPRRRTGHDGRRRPDARRLDARRGERRRPRRPGVADAR